MEEVNSASKIIAQALDSLKRYFKIANEEDIYLADITDLEETIKLLETALAQLTGSICSKS